MLKYIRALPLVIVAGAVVYFSIIICLDNGDWTYIFARVFGMDAENANNLAYIAIAIQSLFFTSDWFYKQICTFLNRRLENARVSIGKFIWDIRLGFEF